MITVIQVENLSKKYIISHQKQENYPTLRNAIMKSVTRIGRQITKPFYMANNGQFKTSEEFWALKRFLLRSNKVIAWESSGETVLVNQLY